jgi:hypothetical protein
VPLPFESLPAALPALTNLRVSYCQCADVSGLTGLRRLDAWALDLDPPDLAVDGLSLLTALEDLSLAGGDGPLAQPSDLAPLTALTRLALWCVPPELASHPVVARLRRLELQAFGVLEDAPGGGDGSGANGAAAAALAALARGAPLLEQLRIHVSHFGRYNDTYILGDYPCDVELGAPLGPGVAWPSLTHLQVTPWAALLLAECAFPRLSRLVADMNDEGGDQGIASNEPLRTAVATLAAKARDHVALRVDTGTQGPADAAGVLAAAAAVPGLRHLSWERSWQICAAASAAPPPGDWAHLAASLESLELVGRLDSFGYGEPVAALTSLTHLFLRVIAEDAAAMAAPALPPAGGVGEGGEPPVGLAGSVPARAARALARLPRLAHLRVTYPQGESPGDNSNWGCPAVAAELARCPALRLLEIDRRDGALWRHERGPPFSPGPCMPRPSPAWPPFAEALRAGGFRGSVRPVCGVMTGIDSNYFGFDD